MTSLNPVRKMNKTSYTNKDNLDCSKELSNGVKISVAQHVIELIVSGPDNLVQQISQAYQLFIIPSGIVESPHTPLIKGGTEGGIDHNPELTINLEFSDKLTPSAEARLYLTDDILRIRNDYLEGSVDLKSGQGLVKINPCNLKYSLGLFLRNLYTLLVILKDDGIALHATGVLVNGEAYLFIGPSRAGKTTIAKLSTGKTVLSDDLILIKKYHHKFSVFPTPSWGEFQNGYRENRPYPIKALFKPIKDKKVFVERLPKVYAMADFFTIPHIPVDTIPKEALLERFRELCSEIPCYALHFKPEPSFWECLSL